MANGDEALAAGLDVVGSGDDKRQGYDEINKTRDYIAGVLRRWFGVGAVTTQERVVTQHVFGSIPATAVPSISETASFPLPFASVPITHVDYIGGRNEAAGAPVVVTGLVDVAPTTMGKGVAPTLTGVTVVINRSDGANLSNGWNYYYAITATGVLA